MTKQLLWEEYKAGEPPVPVERLLPTLRDVAAGAPSGASTPLALRPPARLLELGFPALGARPDPAWRVDSACRYVINAHMNVWFLSAVLLSAAPAGSTLQVKLVGLRNDRGTARIAVFATRDGWPQQDAKAVRRTVAKIDQGHASASFEGLPPAPTRSSPSMTKTATRCSRRARSAFRSRAGAPRTTRVRRSARPSTKRSSGSMGRRPSRSQFGTR